MPNNRPCDFEGWATKNDLLCDDGVIIKSGAFGVKDGDVVPVVWNHMHDSITNTLGHATLWNRKEGIYAKVYLNDTEGGLHAKKTVQNGDLGSLSICATDVSKTGNYVTHGIIREVSLVLAGANPGAKITSVLAHGMPLDDEDEEAILCTGEPIFIGETNTITHSSTEEGRNKDEEDPKKKEKDSDETISDVLATLNEKQKVAVSYTIAELLKKQKEKDEEDPKKKKETVEHATKLEGGEEMPHNAFENGSNKMESAIKIEEAKATIMQRAKACGSFRQAMEEAVSEGGVLYHAVPTDGMTTPTGTQTYGVNSLDMLLPDGYHPLTDRPEFISRDMGWVTKWNSRIRKTPFKRIKSWFADITEDEARARGYIKGSLKVEEVISLLKRSTDPQTIYKKQKLDRDDIVDLDFDVTPWLKGEMEIMLEEEKARAELIGDGRLASSPDKIQEVHIRPVIKDAALFNTVVKVTVPADADDNTIVEAIIDTMIKSRKDWKGTGTPTFWTVQERISSMLTIKDKIGRRLYESSQSLATTLMVDEIVPVEPMEGMKLTIDSKEYPLIGVVVNPYDYTIGGSTEREKLVTEGFDIDYNQHKYLIEDRLSGALTKPFAALTFVLDVQAASEGTKPAKVE